MMGDRRGVTRGSRPICGSTTAFLPAHSTQKRTAMSDTTTAPASKVSSLDPPTKRGVRLFLRLSLTSATLGLITCATLGILIFIHLDDQAPFDDADLRARPEAISADQNAGPWIRKAMAPLDSLYFWNTKTADGTPLAKVLAEARFGSFALGGPPAPAGDAASWEVSPVRPLVETALSEHAEFYARLEAAPFDRRRSLTRPVFAPRGPAALVSGRRGGLR